MNGKEKVVSAIIVLTLFFGFILFMREFEANDIDFRTPIYEWQLR